MNTLVVYRIDWTEYERGLGQRPDGSTLHLDKVHADEYVEDYWERLPSHEVPDEYSAPGKPYTVSCSQYVYDAVKKAGGTMWLKPDIQVTKL